MVGDATIKTMEALIRHKFDPDKGNAFSYFTKIAYNAFINKIKKENLLQDTLKNFQNYVYDTQDNVPNTGECKNVDHKTEYDG